jgi:penicillin-binding protein 2
MGYAPAGEPRLAVAVIVEHGQSGGLVAAPVARYVFDTALLPPRQRVPWPPSGVEVAQPMSPEV